MKGQKMCQDDATETKFFTKEADTINYWSVTVSLHFNLVSLLRSFESNF